MWLEQFSLGRRNMCSYFKIFYFYFAIVVCQASYKEQYRVPHEYSQTWESYILKDKEYLIENLPVTWENANILCRGHHNGNLAVLDTREKFEFLAEALSESQLEIESVWVGARRDSSEDPEGYRWNKGVELRRTAADILMNEKEDTNSKHFPLWLNRTHIPVPEGGADCVALERVQHDKPVFLDLSCLLERPFVCEKDAKLDVAVQELKVVRCRTGIYHIFDGRLNWEQAAAHCVIKKMTLANIGTMRCLRKLGVTMLKSRPSIESAWVGAKGSLGRWTWMDSGLSIFQASTFTDVAPENWPPMRDRTTVKQSGCLQLDRHTTRDPVFLEARCERRMQFICYKAVWANESSRIFEGDEDDVQKFPKTDLTKSQKVGEPEGDVLQHTIYSRLAVVELVSFGIIAMGLPLKARIDLRVVAALSALLFYGQVSAIKGVMGMRRTIAIPSDDNYYYVLVKQQFYWQHAYENCLKMNGTLASVENREVLIQLLLVMGENKDTPVEHIWISGRLNMTKDASSEVIQYFWHNPANGKRIPDPKNNPESEYNSFMPPWLDEDFTMDNPCLNLDRQDHLNGLVYGLSCDTPQYSICLIEKEKTTTKAAENVIIEPTL